MVVTFFLIVTVVFMVTRLAMLIPWPPFLSFRGYFQIAFEQYKDYLTGILTDWDWGMNMRGEPLWPDVHERMKLSLRINIAVFLTYVTVGIGLGMIAALKKDTLIDDAIGVFTMVFGAIPSFIMVFIVVLVFAHYLEWLPRFYPTNEDGMRRHMGLIIPVLALAGPPIATISRLVRGELVETANADYIDLAKVKGLNRRQCLLRHGLKNSITPVMPEISSLFILVMMSAFFVEVVYVIPGMARLFLESIYNESIHGPHFLIHTPTVTTICAFYALLGLSVALLIDILYGFIDPTIKLGSKK